MAEGGGQEDRSTEDLSDEISQYRLEEHRNKGQVSQSRELTGLVALLASGVAIYALAPRIGAEMLSFMREVFRTDFSAHADLGNNHLLSDTMMKSLKVGAAIGLPVCIIGFLTAALASFAQVGSIFSVDPLTPSLDKINPLSGFKRWFALKHLLDSLRMTFKLAVAVAVAYGISKTQVLSSPALYFSEGTGLIEVMGKSASVMFLSLIGVLVVFAVLDFYMQRHEYNKQLRLTKQEAKQEHKEKEGDPQIKARIRSLQREMARKRMMSAVKKADVIITNPTHFAIAIQYDREKFAAPRVVAKGADFIAQRIKEIARDSNVPIVENVPLARTLFKSVKVGQLVPRALYQAVAEVLAYVYRLKNRHL